MPESSQAADETKLAAAKDGTAKRGWVEKSLEEKGYRDPLTAYTSRKRHQTY